MRTYDIDITLHLRCIADNEGEALQIVIENFDKGVYNNHTDKEFEITKCEEIK